MLDLNEATEALKMKNIVRISNGWFYEARTTLNQSFLTTVVDALFVGKAAAVNDDDDMKELEAWAS